MEPRLSNQNEGFKSTWIHCEVYRRHSDFVSYPKNMLHSKRKPGSCVAFSGLLIPRFEAAPPLALPPPGGLAEAPQLWVSQWLLEGGGSKGGLLPPPSDQLPRVPFCPNGEQRHLRASISSRSRRDGDYGSIRKRLGSFPTEVF